MNYYNIIEIGYLLSNSDPEYGSDDIHDAFDRKAKRIGAGEIIDKKEIYDYIHPHSVNVYLVKSNIVGNYHDYDSARLAFELYSLSDTDILF